MADGRSADLWRSNDDLVSACAEHPFVRGIAAGDLPRERFVFYIGQDAFFLEAFAHAYALAGGKAPDRDAMATFHELQAGVLRELELHHGYAARWGVDTSPPAAPATLAYTQFLGRVARSEAVDRIAAAMTPCMRLYAHLGHRMAPVVTGDNPYLDWVETYADPTFARMARRIEEIVDRYDDGSEELAARYRTAMRLELGFFEAAWKSGGG